MDHSCKYFLKWNISLLGVSLIIFGLFYSKDQHTTAQMLHSFLNTHPAFLTALSIHTWYYFPERLYTMSHTTLYSSSHCILHTHLTRYIKQFFHLLKSRSNTKSNIWFFLFFIFLNGVGQQQAFSFLFYSHFIQIIKAYSWAANSDPAAVQATHQ